MHRTKLIEVWKTLSNLEMKHLGEMMASPFYNKKKEVLDLWKLLRKNHPDYPETRVEKQLLFGKIFTDKAYDDVKMRHLTAQLMRITEQFLMHRVLDELPELRSAIINRGLIDRRLYQLAERNVKKNQDKLNRDKHRDSNWHQLQSWNFAHLWQIYTSKFRGSEQEVVSRFDYEGQLQNEFSRFLYDLCMLYFYRHTHQSMFGLQTDLTKIEVLITTLEPELEKVHPVLHGFLRLINLYRTQGEKEYYLLKDVVLANYDKMSFIQARRFYIELENFCHRKTIAGEEAWAEEEFALFDMEMLRGDYKLQGSFPFQLFTRMVTAASSTGRIGWAKNLVENHQHELKDDVRDSIVHYAQSVIHFYQGEFAESLRLLSLVNYDSYYSKFELRLLRIRLYYELGEHLALEALLDSTKHFLNDARNIPEARKRLYCDFVNMTTRIERERLKPDGLKGSDLLAQLQDMKGVSYRKWLTEKCSQLRS